MLTKHVICRAQQRSIMPNDLGLVYEFGTTTDQGVILTKNDISEAEREAKDLINRLNKLKDVFVAADGRLAIVWFIKRAHFYGGC